MQKQNNNETLTESIISMLEVIGAYNDVSGEEKSKLIEQKSLDLDALTVDEKQELYKELIAQKQIFDNCGGDILLLDKCD